MDADKALVILRAFGAYEWPSAEPEDYESAVDAVEDTIERLQRELLQADRDYGDAEKRYLSESAKRTQAERERDNAIREAQTWKQEARTQRATVANCYEAVTGKTGEPGDWHGSQPVVAAIHRLNRERDEARAERDAFWDALTEVEAFLRNDVYKNRVTNALAIIDEVRHIDRDALRAALGGEG